MCVSLGVFPALDHCPVGSPGWLGRFPASRWPGVPLARCPVGPVSRWPGVPLPVSLSRWPGVPLSRCPVGGGAPLSRGGEGASSSGARTLLLKPLFGASTSTCRQGFTMSTCIQIIEGMVPGINRLAAWSFGVFIGFHRNLVDM